MRPVAIRWVGFVSALAACGGGASGEGEATSSETTSDTSSSETSSGGAPVAPLGPWRVMTFNVMCQTCTPKGYEGWTARLPHLGDTIARHDPELIGVQELFSAANVDELLAVAPGYEPIWFAAPTPDDLDYADATILYRPETFEPVEHGFYWLSPEPDTPYSNGFAAPQLPRLVAWARLRVRDDGSELVFATTHFDNNTPSQELSAPLVLARTAALADAVPVVMVGDFNARPDEPAYAILTGGVDGIGPRFDDVFDRAGAWRSETNLEPAPVWDPGARIDHLFVAGAPWMATDYVVDQWVYGEIQQYTSDHFAIVATLAVP